MELRKINGIIIMKYLKKEGNERKGEIRGEVPVADRGGSPPPPSKRDSKNLLHALLRFDCRRIFAPVPPSPRFRILDPSQELRIKFNRAMGR